MKIKRLRNTRDPVTVQGHIVCRRCGRGEDIDGVTVDAACLTAADDHGFVVIATEIFCRGLCQDCSL